jgi:hypothetical protein
MNILGIIMTTSEIFMPFILSGLFAAFGSFATLCAFAVKGYTILDADKADSVFQRPPSEKGRQSFFLLFIIPAFIVGGIWGLVYTGAFIELINGHLSYAISTILGIFANTAVLKLNDMSIKQFIDIIKINLPTKN